MTDLPIATGERSIVATHGSAIGLPLLVVGIALLAISANEYQIFYQIHASTGRVLVEASHGVLYGHPPWKAFQARLLGPLAFAGFEAAVGWLRVASPAFYAGFERVFAQSDTRELVALDAFIAMMIVAKNLIFFGLLLRYTGSLVKAAGGSIFGSILFIVLSDYWLYMWDMFELIFFCFLAFMMFNGKKPGAGFLLVFALALVNRESAAFFGVWLLCYAAAHRLIDGHILWREAVAGIVLVVVTLLYVTTLRNYLLVESTLGHETSNAWVGSRIVTDDGTTLHQALGNHLLILENGLRFLKNRNCSPGRQIAGDAWCGGLRATA